jgi:6-phosphogluconolactonase/glucosamine-6-phosphate isomerase/deaminase
MELVVAETPRAAARALAGRITVVARQAMGRRGVCNLLVGSGPQCPALFAALVDTEIFWGRVNVFQADELVVPDGDTRRSSTVLVEELADQVGLPPGRLHLVDAGGADPTGALRRHVAALPDRLDVAVVGVGGDGRVTGWDDDAVLAAPEPFALTAGGDAGGEARRIVATPAGVQRAEHRFALVCGAEWAAALARLQTPGTGPAADALAPLIVHADRAAAGG